jgi:hypothetical protein
MVLLAVVLAAGYAGLRGLSAAYAKPERDARTLAAMQQAKQALLGYAANRARLFALDPPGTTLDVPGALPCPALNLTTLVAASQTEQWGRARRTCSPTTQRMGRLPWLTLELPQMVDSTGASLWYAVSRDFRYVQDGSAPSTPAVNAHNRGRIRLVSPTGAVIQDRVVAVIIAPGATLAGQSRGTPAQIDDPLNHLEAFAVAPDANTDFSFRLGPATDGPPAFNDIVLPITEAELFDAIENAIAARLEESIMPLLARHRAFWGTLPFATGSFDPSQTATALTGSIDALWGHLPVAQQSAAFTGWTQLVGGTATVTACSGPFAAALPNAVLECQVTGAPGTTFTVEATVSNVNAGVFAEPVASVSPGGSAGITLTGQPITASLNATVRIQGTVITGGSLQFTVTGPAQLLNAASSPLPPAAEWFLHSGWAKFVYYQRCSDASTTCLTVNGMTGAPTAARATLVLAGRPTQKIAGGLLQNQSTVTTVGVGEYLEPPHDAPGGSVFQRGLRTAGFNDRVVAMP